MLILKPLLAAEAGVQGVGDFCGPATACSASARAGGSDFPRRSARRRIPAHAFALKKYLCGIESVSSTCDNEHTAASLGQAEILGIKNPPRDCPFGSIHTTSVCPPSPWRLQFAAGPSERAKKAAEGVISGGKDAGDVFPHDDAGGFASGGANMVNCIGNLAEGKG